MHSRTALAIGSFALAASSFGGCDATVLQPGDAQSSSVDASSSSGVTTSSGPAASGAGVTSSGGQGGGFVVSASVTTGGAAGGETVGSQASGSGGAGVGGGSQVLCSGEPRTDHAPVPGCEALAWVGDPLIFPLNARQLPQVATLEGGDVGLVSIAGLGQQDDVVARRLVDAFGAWPPAVSAVAAVLDEHDNNQRPAFSARPDGTFAAYARGVGAAATFGAPGVLRSFDGGGLFLDPTPGAGGFLVDGLGTSFRYLASLSPEEVPVSVYRRSPGCQELSGFVTPGGSFLGAWDATGSDVPRCPAAATSVRTVRVDGDGRKFLADVDLGVTSSRSRLVARPGGAWLVVEVEGPRHACVVPLDETGTAASAGWANWSSPPLHQVLEVAPWDGGFALAQSSDRAGGLEVWVSDGERMSRSNRADVQVVTSNAIAITASADGRSVLVAFDGVTAAGVFAMFVMRADCVDGG